MARKRELLPELPSSMSGMAAPKRANATKVVKQPRNHATIENRIEPPTAPSDRAVEKVRPGLSRMGPSDLNQALTQPRSLRLSQGSWLVEPRATHAAQSASPGGASLRHSSHEKVPHRVQVVT